jgi:hypothetical protein
VIRIELGVTDIGRIRFAAAPAPILDAAMALFELRAAVKTSAAHSRQDWRVRIRGTFPAAARPPPWTYGPPSCSHANRTAANARPLTLTS